MVRKKMQVVLAARVELAASRLRGGRSGHLSYASIRCLKGNAKAHKTPLRAVYGPLGWCPRKESNLPASA